MELLTLTNLKPAAGSRKKKKRVGRGIGSGHGKTSTRGHNGQHARNTTARGNEGGQTPLYQRLPKLRGKAKGAMPLGPTRKHYAIVNLSQLERLESGSTHNALTLRANGLVKGRWDGIRVLGVGELTKPLTISANHFSETARAAIEAAGGTCEVVRGRPSYGGQTETVVDSE